MGNRRIEQIKIPVKQEELDIKTILLYIDKVLSEFKANAKIIRENYDRYCLDQPISSKQRQYEDEPINNIVVIPNLRSTIEWVIGYTIGNPIKYAQTKDNQTDDIEILNKHFRSARKFKVDEEWVEWALVTGVGYTFIQPRTGTFNIEEVAPFEIYSIDADRCTKVYSSYLGNKPLFDLIYNQYEFLDENKIKYKQEILDIYTTSKKFTLIKKQGERDWSWSEESRGLYQYLPLTEKRRCKDGIGLVELGKDLADTMDALISSGLDDIEEIVNQFFVYYNVGLGNTPDEQANTHRKARKNGVAVLNGGNKEMPPKIDTISPQLNLQEVRYLYGLVNEVFHAVCGAPMETSNTNSGGTTKQGSEVANGYDNAYTRFLKNSNYFLDADYELLEKVMWIEKNKIGSKIETLTAYDMTVKYQPNLTDNILTKSQSYGTFIQTMPPAMALRYTRLSSDPEAEGKLIENCPAYIQAMQKGETIDIVEETKPL